VRTAIEEVIERELQQVREVEEAIAEDDAHPDGSMTADAVEAWMIEINLTTHEALARARARQQGA
jgi:hypothetical protein